MLTIKILFTANSLLKKTILSKHHLQFLSFKKNPQFWLEKNSFNCILIKKITKKEEK